MPHHSTSESDDIETIEYRFRSIDSSGSIELKETTAVCKMSAGLGTWEYEIPLDKVAPFPVRYTLTPCSVWLIVGIALFGMTFAVLSLLDREMQMMNPFTATALLGVTLLLILYAWRNRRVVWIIFPSDSLKYHIQFCHCGPHHANFESFAGVVAQRVKQLHHVTADELLREPEPPSGSN